MMFSQSALDLIRSFQMDPISNQSSIYVDDQIPTTLRWAFKVMCSARSMVSSECFKSQSDKRHGTPSRNTILKAQIRRFSLANLFIQKLKFLTVRQKFKDCLEPFDVADIMEQYKSGHLEMLARVKVIQHQ